MPQVLIVSNRLPVSVTKEDGKLKFSPSIGGLATGLSSYVKKRNNVWVGWPGIASDDLTDKDKRAIVEGLAKHNCSPVFLTKRQIDDYYNGYSNTVLWPLFHNMSFAAGTDKQYEQWWRAYRSVNKAFSEAVLNHAEPNGYVWVHDYQLLLLPELLRASANVGNIGFFLHIPFPDAKTFTKLPEARKLLRGMLGADLLGFHTPSYVRHFLDTCHEAGLGVVSEESVTFEDHAVRVGDFPMGIDYDKYAIASQSKVVKTAMQRYRKRYKGLKVIAAVDRMDPSKGLVQRLEAYRDLLDQNPNLRGKVVFSMIAAPSRTDVAAYQQLAERLDGLVENINETYGSANWQPVDYINSAQPFEEVTALFGVADVAFIAPLRDGMNLAAKEYVASANKPGALILSETAGAAEELRAALLVNPRRRTSLVNALQQSLSMSKMELNVRLRKMQRYLATHSVQAWAKTFIDTLQQPVAGTPGRTQMFGDKLQQSFSQSFQQASKRLLLLDYDGSLVPFSEDAAAAKPSKSLLSLLENLSSDSHNEVVIVSGRTAKDLEKWLGNLPVSLIAEHGGAIRKKGQQRWHTHERAEQKWKRAIEPVLTHYAAQTPGASVEVKLHSLVWHYRGASPYYAQKSVVTLKKVLKPLLEKHGLKLFQGNKILEIKDPRISKGGAIESWLSRRHDLTLIIGDDFTDEDMFRVAPLEAYTVKVGRGRTKARFRLKSPSEVKRLLHKLIT